MEFLINPNISYTLLILGFLVAILALFAPGTGFLEVVALFALALAGYGILNLPVNIWALGILLLSVLPFILALRQPNQRRLLYLGAAVLIFLAGSALLFPWQGWMPVVNPLLIAVLSGGVIGFSWLLASKSVEAMAVRPAFDMDQLIGMTGEVSSDIHGQGTVYVNGEEWTACSKAFLPAGSAVRVIRREGLTLEVESIKS